MDPQQAFVPGPGTYQNDNNWTRRTYNLKFLNFNGVKGSDTGYAENMSHNRSRSLNNTIDASPRGVFTGEGMGISNGKQLNSI